MKFALPVTRGLFAKGTAMKNGTRILGALIAALLANSASAAPIYWTDWTGSDLDPGVGFQGTGTITTPTSTVGVTYTNPQGVGFYQPTGGNYYYSGGTDGPDGTSPYTSSVVDNRPPTSDIIALAYAGTQSLSFSEAIANPVFAYVSLNGNGYAFDQDFNILSVGGADGNACGYWGCGTSYKEVVTVNGVTEYRLLGTGEPHGVLQFTGTFATVSWRSLSNEYWNGFTLGVGNAYIAKRMFFAGIGFDCNVAGPRATGLASVRPGLSLVWALPAGPSNARAVDRAPWPALAWRFALDELQRFKLRLSDRMWIGEPRASGSMNAAPLPVTS